MDPGPSREPIPPERAMVLASRREARGTPRAWLAALSIVTGIAATGILFHTWPSQLTPLPATSHEVAVMQAPVARAVGVEATVAQAAGVPGPSGRVRRRGSPPPVSDVFERTPVSPAAEQTRVARSAVEAGLAQVTAALETRPVTFVTMTEPALVPESFAGAGPAPSEAPSGIAPFAAVTRAVVAAGKGITNGFKLTGASIKSAF